MTAGEWIQVVTVAVLGVTLAGVFWYACETKRMAKATVKLAEASMRPLMLLWIEEIAMSELSDSPVAVHYRNIGNGPAVKIRWRMAPDVGEWLHTPERVGMGVREAEPKPLPYKVQQDKVEEVRTSEQSIVVDYEDALGRSWKTIHHIYAKDDKLVNGTSEYRGPGGAVT